MSFRPYPVMTLCAAISLVLLGMLGQWQWARFQSKTQVAGTVPAWTELAPPDGNRLWLSTIHDGRSAWRGLRVIVQDGRGVLATDRLVFAIDPPDMAEPAGPDPALGRGLLRPFPGSDRFAAPASLPDRVFYGFDRAGMAEAAGLALSEVVFEPEMIRFIEEDGTSRLAANPWADPSLLDPLPPARHLGYALTWWGMALGLLVLYLVYHVQAGRLKFGDGR